jgi:hypothetical protein
LSILGLVSASLPPHPDETRAHVFASPAGLILTIIGESGPLITLQTMIGPAPTDGGWTACLLEARYRRAEAANLHELEMVLLQPKETKTRISMRALLRPDGSDRQKVTVVSKQSQTGRGSS